MQTIAATTIRGSTAPLPTAPAQRSLLGLPYLSLTPNQPLVLDFASSAGPGPQRLLLTVAVDSLQRLPLKVSTADGQSLVELEVTFPSVGERVLIPLPPLPPGSVRLHLELGGEAALHLLHAPEGRAELAALAPQLMPDQPGPIADAERVAALAQHLRAPTAWAPWGWMGGCVIDALDAASEANPAWLPVLDAYIDRYLDSDQVRYEDHESRIVDGRMAGIESALPYAAVARRRPDHPCLEVLRHFVDAHDDGEGGIIDGRTTSSEGSYTVAWSLLRLAERDGDPRRHKQALTQLRLRRDRLWHDGALWLRQHAGEVPSHTYRGWSRGVAWYLLGLTRCLAALDPAERPADLLAECERALGWVAGHQRADGLWGNMLEQPDLDADTSGSAGIAAALALAAQVGLPGGDRARALASWQGLASRSDASGYPLGTAPNNKAVGGFDLQLKSRRSCIHFGMGLVAQLACRLGLLPGPG